MVSKLGASRSSILKILEREGGLFMNVFIWTAGPMEEESLLSCDRGPQFGQICDLHVIKE